MREQETYLENINGELVIKEEYTERLKTLKQAKEVAERELKSLSAAIQDELKEHCTTTTKVGKYTFVLKGGYWTTEFDLEKFKSENLELYVKYLKAKEVPISYQLVSAERVKKEKKEDVQ